jgi:hypothetical protein
MLPLMTTAQIFFSFVAAALVLAGGWFYFRWDSFRLTKSSGLILSGYILFEIIEGGMAFRKLLFWLLVFGVVQIYFNEKKGKIKLSTPEENEQPQPSGN